MAGRVASAVRYASSGSWAAGELDLRRSRDPFVALMSHRGRIHQRLGAQLQRETDDVRVERWWHTVQVGQGEGDPPDSGEPPRGQLSGPQRGIEDLRGSGRQRGASFQHIWLEV